MSNAAAIARMKARLAQTPSRGVDITNEVLRDRTLMPPPPVLAAMSVEDRARVLSHGDRRRMQQLELFGSDSLGGG